MKIQPVEKHHFPLIKDFILPFEYTCVQLSFYVRKENENLYVISDKQEISQVEDICGILYFDNSLLHCIPDLDKVQNSDFVTEFKTFIKLKNIKCMSGEKNTSEFLLNLMSEEAQNPFQTLSYNLMLLDEDPLPPPEELSCDDYIKRCTEDDMEALIEIQKQYLISEVMPAGKTVTNMESAMLLRQILKNQLAVALVTDDEIVAKANSNAIGWNWVQIGGVYTHPLYRRNSYAWHLVYDLCRRVRKTQRNCCLFVKEKNNAAFQLYTQIGFITCCKYQISYFSN